MDYDGFTKVELEIMPKSETTVDDLSIVFPLRDTAATLAHAVGDSMRDGQWSGLIPAKGGTVFSSLTQTRNQNVFGSFIPYLWFGTEERGLCWAAESDQGWLLDDSRAAVELVRSGKEVQLVVHLVHGPTKLAKPQRVVFGWMATPVKPMPKGWRGWRIDPWNKANYPKLPGTTQSIQLNTHQAYFYKEMAASFGHYCYDWSILKKNIEQAKRDVEVDRIVLTTTLNIMAAGTPEAQAFQDEWFHASGIVFDNGSFSTKSFGADRKNYYYGTAPLVPSMIDFRLWAIKESIEKGGADGTYEDNTYLWPYADKDLGIGWERPDGKFQPSLMFFSHREFHRREATVMKQCGKEALIWPHMSTAQILPSLSFCTIAYDHEWHSITGDDGNDFMDKWPLDYIRAVDCWQHTGLVPIGFPPLSSFHGSREARDKHVRTMMAVHMLHDIITDNPSGGAEWLKMNQAKSKFGIGDDSVEFAGYWNNGAQAVITPSEDCKLSYWRKPDSALLVLVNFARAERTATLRLKLDGLPSEAKATDAQTGEEIPCQGGGKDIELQSKIPPRDFRMILISK
jgi:hypothetical protein